jgi:hypothetical protein
MFLCYHVGQDPFKRIVTDTQGFYMFQCYHVGQDPFKQIVTDDNGYPKGRQKKKRKRRLSADVGTSHQISNR